MSKSARRLGRGLDSLVPHLRTAPPLSDVASAPLNTEGTDKKDPDVDEGLAVRMVPLQSLHPNELQPRNEITRDNVMKLAQSIQQNGMLQPITARYVSGSYEIIAGERRWRAAQSLGLTTVPVIVRTASDEQMLELALIENLQREDLNAIERARAYHDFSTHFSLKPEEIANRLGEDRSTVVNYLRLLDLSDRVQSLVADGLLSMGHARCLLGLSNEVERLEFAESAVAKGLSVRALEDLVRRRKTDHNAGPTEPREGADPRQAHRRDIERRFEEALGTRVTIREGRRKGSGRIVIEYYSLDDFDRIAARLNVPLE